MTVPTHNLYDFVHQALENKFLLYYFYPYGSKNLERLISYKNYTIDEKSFCYRVFPKKLIDNDLYSYFNPEIICNDQEPLDFEFYQNRSMHSNYIEKIEKTTLPGIAARLENFQWKFPSSRKKYLIILHSELNSKQVDLYNQSEKFVCAYWWSHAVLALDWYRFAEHDKFLNPASELKKIFLLYSRAHTGSREYRTTLLNFIQDANITQCQIGSFDKDYNSTSNSSAEYSFKDINQSAIQIVAETVFDERKHLTEKTLRPIACGQPFILAAGPGSLKYLQSYGFKTFGPWINEDYDSELDSTKRLQMIVQEMKRIENLPDSDKNILIKQCLKISQYNKKMFFSNAFFDKVKKELITNVGKAEQTANNEFDWKFMWSYRQERKRECRNSYKANPRNYYEMKFIRHLKQGGTIEDYEPPTLD
jgi:hypothetical protein